MNARQIAQAGLLITLQILTLLMAFIIPTIKLALLFASSLFPGVLLRIGAAKKVIVTSAVSSVLLALFLVQIPEVQAGFAVFFAWYALLHEGTKQMNKIKQQIIRLLFFLISLALIYLAATYVFPIQIDYAIWLIAILAAAAFILMQLLYELTVKEFIKISKIKLIDGKITFK